MLHSSVLVGRELSFVLGLSPKSKSLVATRVPVLPNRVACAGKKKGGKDKGGGGDGGGGGGGGAEAGDVDTEGMLNDWSAKMNTCVEKLQEGLVTIRAGKATAALLDNIKVKAYESEKQIKELATVSATDTTTLSLTTWDEDVTPSVAKAIMGADLGYTVQETSPTSIKVNIPPLTKEKRAAYIKLAKENAEGSKVAVRNVRQAAMKKIKSLKKDLSEDIAKSMEKDMEARVKKVVAEIDSIFKRKESDLESNK